MSDFATPWTAARPVMLCFAISQSWLKRMSTESVMPSNHLILGHPLLCLPPMRWPKYWELQPQQQSFQ